MQSANGSGSSCHAVMLRVEDCGLLLTGPPRVGKSDLALQLIARGHALICDDLVHLHRQDQRLIAAATEHFSGFLMVRELGLVDVAALYGARALAGSRPVDLVLDLLPDAADPGGHVDPLAGNWSQVEWLGIQVPSLALHGAAGRDLATLTECALRCLRRRRDGHDDVTRFRQLVATHGRSIC